MDNITQKRLRLLRDGDTLRNFSQKLGVHLNTYQNYEAGKRKPSTEFLKRVSESMNVSIEWLLGMDKGKEDLPSEHPKEEALVGGTLRENREKLGYTQEQMALYLEMSKGYVNLIETGKRPMTQKLRERLTKIVNHGAPIRSNINNNSGTITMNSVHVKDGELEEIKRRLDLIETDIVMIKKLLTNG